MNVALALDAMSGDRGPEVIVAAALAALKHHGNLTLLLVGDESCLRQLLPSVVEFDPSRLRIVHAPEVVSMHERPSIALRNKRNSSMRVAIDLVKNAEAAACVSSGNTGALMAIARFVLKTLPGIDRPAICTALPGVTRPTHMLDLGANVDSTSEELFRFAVMGSVLASAIDNTPSPKVALLNIGQEEIKGNDTVKQTAALLEASELNYAGFVEGDDIFASKVDVIVCDGFVGNVALKASEGVAHLVKHVMREEFSRGLLSRLMAGIASPVLGRVGRRMDPRRYNGASFLGLRGSVVKSHGSADALSFEYAIDEAILEVEKKVPERISDLLEHLLVARKED
ncbi:MAG: phosphate acyltransferase PlsX [Gammaproteobacteria bacterium]|nr:phosphate acyltransferase PlsX [Gammaproteobacteria bacterium]